MSIKAKLKQNHHQLQNFSHTILGSLLLGILSMITSILPSKETQKKWRTISHNKPLSSNYKKRNECQCAKPRHRQNTFQILPGDLLQKLVRPQRISITKSSWNRFTVKKSTTG